MAQLVLGATNTNNSCIF